MFKAILVPVDLAELEIAKPALDVAVEFLRLRDDSKLRLLNVQTLLPAGFMEYVPANFDVDQQERAMVALEEFSATLQVPPERISYTVRIGGIYPEILAEAEEWKADIIVIGSHRPAMSTYLLGSNAKTVVRHANCSVLVVRT
jgi:nucleotide-binding universal stress UspA family protein